MHKLVNYTSVTLIPKVKNTITIMEFWPMSCCNTLDKLIPKVFTHKMKHVMITIVDAGHAVFVSGRVITDNIILSREMVRRYGRKGMMHTKT